MTFPITCRDIDELIERAVSWASTDSFGKFMGTSKDRGKIRLIAREFSPLDGLFYSEIEISFIKIPEKRRKQGLYRSFLQQIDSLDKFGVRRHDTTWNDSLAEHHRRHGYSEGVTEGHSPSFWVIIGRPLDHEKQKQLRKHLAERAFPEGRPRSRGGLIQRKVPR